MKEREEKIKDFVKIQRTKGFFYLPFNFITASKYFDIYIKIFFNINISNIQRIVSGSLLKQI